VLRRSDPAGSGIRRRRRGRGFRAAIRLIDLGFFQSGGEEYADENGTFGLATINKEHVTVTKGQLMFDYLAKGAKQREQAVAEDQVCAVVRSFRTWHATVLATVGLAVSEPAARSDSARKRAVKLLASAA
jgi:DNA topoisomerase IB